MNKPKISILFLFLLFSTEMIGTVKTAVDYGEALQKSLFFYEAQQAGVLPEWNEVSWRGDSMETDFIPGGWFDAGDHFKFTHTIAYTATVLAWGLVDYASAVEKAGLLEKYKLNLKWGLDYLVLADKGDSVVGTIGADGFDHSWWGSPEVYLRKMKLVTGKDERPYDLIKCSSTIALMASALAAGYLVYKDDGYLSHAKSLFKLADTTRTKASGMASSYYPITDFFDDLFFAANFLYMATGDKSYLEKAEKEYIPEFPLENQSTERKFTWGFCWDDSSQAAALLYAINTKDKEWIDHIQHHLDYWTVGYGGKKVSYTPDGLAWLFQWGATRHAANTAWLAIVAADKLFKDNAELYKRYKDFAKSTYDYIFGDNKLGLSYVLGVGAKNPKTVHHRGASGIHDDSWTALGTGSGAGGSSEHQTEYAHLLYGALEGGPGASGDFNDKVSAYENTEVAIDYNAGYTAGLCGMINDYGGKKDPSFPPIEKPKWPEFLMSAGINQDSDTYTELKVFAMNHSAWPARTIKDLSYNYYFDISEVIEAGYTAKDIKTKIGMDQHSGDEGKLSISDPIQYKENIYYVKISFNDGRVVMPTGQSEHKSECQFRIMLPDTAHGAWDSSNDYSFKGVGKGMIETPYITMYDGDTLIWGEEP